MPCLGEGVVRATTRPDGRLRPAFAALSPWVDAGGAPPKDGGSSPPSPCAACMRGIPLPPCPGLATTTATASHQANSNEMPGAVHAQLRPGHRWRLGGGPAARETVAGAVNRLTGEAARREAAARRPCPQSESPRRSSCLPHPAADRDAAAHLGELSAVHARPPGRAGRRPGKPTARPPGDSSCSAPFGGAAGTLTW